MTKQIAPVHKADELMRKQSLRYSICTIVTRPGEYDEMRASFDARGFCEPDCEFLYLDNSKGNAFDAYDGYNLFLNVARGDFIVLCHQDILLMDDGRSKLDAIITDLTDRDSAWAAFGNGGGDRHGQLALRISDPHGTNQRMGDLPAKVRTLDENFIVVRRSANLSLSRDISGFHFYGTDLCLIADVLGWNCYVVDFHLQHKSAGSKDESFFKIRETLIRKYQRALRSRWITTTTTNFLVSGTPRLAYILRGSLLTRILRRLISK